MSADDRITTISELRNGLKNVNCIFIVIEAGTKQQTKDGNLVRKCRVADRTGSIMFSIWNEEAQAIQTGDILKLTRGYSSVWKGSLVLYCGKYGLVEKLGEFTMVFSETPDMSLLPETVSPRSNSPPPTTHSRQQHSSSTAGESSSSSGMGDANNSSYSGEGRGMSSGRHDNSGIHQTSSSGSYSSSQQTTAEQFQDMRHYKGGGGSNGFHPSPHSTPAGLPPPPQEGSSNGRHYFNGHDNNSRYTDRRTHHSQSHDNHMTSNARHHPYQRHAVNNGWR